jgi:intein/homing endonuclease
MNNQVQALADYTFIAKYAKYLPDLKKRESWLEAVERSYDMHKIQYSSVWNELEPHLNIAFDAYKQKLCVGSQRNLQFAGDAVLKKNSRSYNCCGSYCDRLRFFQETMHNLLCGTGVGFSVQKHHVANIPEFDLTEKTEIATFEIEDSIEGWADSIGILVSSYFQNSIYPEYQGKVVKFVYDNIRKKGAAFSHGIGKAPGFRPLYNAHEKIRALLDNAIKLGQTKLRPIDAYDIVMHSSDAVLSGGIRRSATICIFSPDDDEMLNAKTGDWWSTNPQRGRSNNSAILLKDSTSPELFAKLIKCSREFGEPGFYWADSLEMLPNPCVSGETWIQTNNGPQQVKDLIGVPFKSILNGKIYQSSTKGFYETGYQNVYRITTNAGFSIEATDNHPLLLETGEWVSIGNLNIGDSLQVNNNDTSYNWEGSGGTLEEGWLLGNMIGDGCISGNRAYLDYWGENRHNMIDVAINYLNESNLSTNHTKGGECQTDSEVKKSRVSNVKLKELANIYNITGKNKVITPEIEKASSNFSIGFIRGYFDADGSVQGTANKGRSVRLSSINLNNLYCIQRMLLRHGIYSKVYKNRSIACNRNIKGKIYFCQANHELIISKDAMIKYYDIIGFNDSEKQEKLKSYINAFKRIPYKTIFSDKISSIEKMKCIPVYDCNIPVVNAFDANGIIAHNCVEIGFYCRNKAGESGWQFCNLTSVNGSKVKTLNDFYKAAQAATVIGTVQAGYCSFPYLGRVTEEIVKAEALLGVSITGIMENARILLNPDNQKNVAKSLIEINDTIAKIIGINSAARITCIKPEGSTSCMLGTSSGIHPHYAKRFIRRVQANKMESPAKFYEDINPRSSEESLWSANKTDICLSFACEVSDNYKFKKDFTAIELLDKVKSTQINWVENGKISERCSQYWLSHNVSNTINVADDEWDDVEKYIYENRQYFAGISLLSSKGDKDYVQAPFVEVFTPLEITEMYGDASIFVSGIIDDALRAFNGDLWAACSASLSAFTIDSLRKNKESVDHEEEIRKKKLEWIEKVQKFAKKYYKNDVLRVTYLLKDVYNWKMWLDISKSHKKVDYSMMIEEHNTTQGTNEVACAGGVCLV